MRFAKGFGACLSPLFFLWLLQSAVNPVRAQTEESAKPFLLRFTLTQRQAIERVSYDLPFQESPVGPSGISRLLFIEADAPSAMVEDIKVRGFTFRVPPDLKGDLVIWTFLPDEPRFGVRLEPKIFTPKGTTSVQRPSLSLDIANSSWLRRKFPDLGERQVNCMRIPKANLVPGALHTMAFAHDASRSDRIAMAFNFTDGVYEDVAAYLPIQLALPQVD